MGVFVESSLFDVLTSQRVIWRAHRNQPCLMPGAMGLHYTRGDYALEHVIWKMLLMGVQNNKLVEDRCIPAGSVSMSILEGSGFVICLKRVELIPQGTICNSSCRHLEYYRMVELLELARQSPSIVICRHHNQSRSPPGSPIARSSSLCCNCVRYNNGLFWPRSRNRPLGLITQA